MCLSSENGFIDNAIAFSYKQTKAKNKPKSYHLQQNGLNWQTSFPAEKQDLERQIPHVVYVRAKNLNTKQYPNILVQRAL